MLQINATLLLQIINFLLLMWILNRLLFRPFLRVAAERREKTLGSREQAGELEARAEELKEHYESGVFEATSHGASYKQMQRREGLSAGETVVGEARRTCADKISRARRDLEASVSGARKELGQLSIAFSKEITEKILGRTVR